MKSVAEGGASASIGARPFADICCQSASGKSEPTSSGLLWVGIIGVDIYQGIDILHRMHFLKWGGGLSLTGALET